jgi:hypothetical protein
MQQSDKLSSPLSRLRSWLSVLLPSRLMRSRVMLAVHLLRGRDTATQQQAQKMPAVKIAGYSLVLMDSDGQVVWTRDWDSGGVFEFGPRQRLWVCCGFTNHSECETEISEYEIELMDEDGLVVERFGDSFGDSLIIPPGESKHFPADWRM